MGALRSYDLIELEFVKDILGITVTTDDTLLEHLIKAATDYVEGILSTSNPDVSNGGYCNRRFQATTYTLAKYSGGGFKNLLLRQYPINSITTVVIDGTTKYPSGSSTLADVDIYIDDAISGNLINANYWNSGDPQNIQVTYNAGFATIPHDLQLAVAGLVANRWNQKKNCTFGFKSEKIGNYSYTLADVSAENPFGDGIIKDTLDHYVRAE
jgi:hypothetical protein